MVSRRAASVLVAVALCVVLSSAEMFQLDLTATRKVEFAKQSHGKRELFIQALSGCAFNVFDALVSLGSPPQQISLLIDTGSTTIATAGPNCPSCNGEVNQRYTPADSTTSVSNGVSTSATYLDNSGWSGTTYSDVVSIASIPAIRMNFAVITSETNFFGKDCAGKLPSPNAGIMGLAYQSVAVTGTDSYPDKAGDVVYTPDIFAIQLCDTTGSITFGGFNESFANGSPTYIPFVPDNSGSIRFYSVEQNSVSTTDGDTLSSGPFPDTIVDSGTSILIVNTETFNNFIDILNNDPDWPFDNRSPASFFDGNVCPLFTGNVNSLNDNLPGLVFTLGSHTFSLKPYKSYFLPIEDNGDIFLCPGLQASDDVNILGYPFMNQYLSIFDRQNKRMGFAPTDCTKAPAPSSTPVSTLAPSAADTVHVAVAATVAVAAVVGGILALQ